MIEKSKPRWNIFQRGVHNKSGDFGEAPQVSVTSKTQLCSNPEELQRASFATSIDDLPARPTAFQQVRLFPIKTVELRKL